MIDLTPVLQAVISLCAALTTAFIVPWLRQKAGRERTARIYEITKIAVNAAEQLYGAGAGKEKAQYVINYLHSHGYDIDEEELKAALESAVYNIGKA